MELQRKLRARGHGADNISSVLDELADQRLQSDARYVEVYIRSRAERGYGPQRIFLELKQRGIAADPAAQAMAAADCDWLAHAAHADRKKFGRLGERGPLVQARRRRYLEYRGYTAEQIKSVLNAEQALD